MIGIALSLVFGIFGAVMALLSYMDREPRTTNRPRRSPAAAPGASSAAAPAVTPAAAPAEAPRASPAAAPAAPSGDPPRADDKEKGNDKK